MSENVQGHEVVTTTEHGNGTQVAERQQEAQQREVCRPKFRPNVDVVETEAEFQIRADLPGAVGDQIDVHFEDSVLTIKAPVSFEQNSSERFLLREYAVGDYERKFQLGEKIDPMSISAGYANGVLTLHLPKVSSAVPRKIAVNAG